MGQQRVSVMELEHISDERWEAWRGEPFGQGVLCVDLDGWRRYDDPRRDWVVLDAESAERWGREEYHREVSGRHSQHTP